MPDDTQTDHDHDHDHEIRPSAPIEPPNSEPHWVLTALAVQTAGAVRTVPPIDVFETAEPAFDQPGDVRSILSMLARETDFVSRVQRSDGRGYAYFITQDGLDLLEYIGVPDQYPDGTVASFEPDIAFEVVQEPSDYQPSTPDGDPTLDELGVPYPTDWSSDAARARYFAIRDRVEYLVWLDRRRRREEAKQQLPEPDYPDPWKDETTMKLKDAVRTDDVPWEDVEATLQDAELPDEHETDRRKLLMNVQLRLVDRDELAVRLDEIGLGDVEVEADA